MSLLSNLGKKVFKCPGCHKVLRVPIRLGKTLQVSCPICQVQTMISFRSKVADYFNRLIGKAKILAKNGPRGKLSWKATEEAWDWVQELPVNYKIALLMSLFFVFSLFTYSATKLINLALH